MREGRCKKLAAGYRTVSTLEWEVEFEWAGRGKTTPRVVPTRANSAVSQSAAYSAAIQNLIGVNTSVENALLLPTTSTLGQLGALASAPARLASSINASMQQLQANLTDIVSVAQGSSSQSASTQQLAVNHARNSMQQAAGVAQTLSQQGIETLSGKSDARSVLRAHALFGDLQDQARLAARAAQAYYQQLRATLPYAAAPLTGETSRQMSPPPGSLLAVYATRQGDTPKRISQNFYGTPDHDVDLLKANRLAWMTPTFPPGTILIVPVLPTNVNPNSV